MEHTSFRRISLFNPSSLSALFMLLPFFSRFQVRMICVDYWASLHHLSRFMQSFNYKYPYSLPPCPLIIQKSFSGNTVNKLHSLLLSLINKIPVRLPLTLDHVQVTRNLQKSSLLARIKEEMVSGKARFLSEADTEFCCVHSRDFYAVINDQPITEKATFWIVIMWISGSPE